MKTALRSFVIVTLLVLMGFGLAWLYLKSKASSQVIPKALPNTFFSANDEKLVFIRVSDFKKEELKTLHPKIGYWADTQVTRDGKVIVLADRDLENPNYNPNSPDRSPETKLKRLGCRYLNWSDVQKVKPEAHLLEELLNEDLQKRFIINVVEYSPGSDAVMSELISRVKADERIIFHSEQDGPLTDLRKLKPMWLFGTSRAQIVQTLFLITIGLEGIAPLKGDVLITPYHAEESNQKTLLLKPDLVAEAKRRSMKVLVGPVTKSEADELSQLGIDGVITSEPLKFSFPQL